MKLLNGKDIADYVKERQAKQVRALRQADGIDLRLAIIVTNDDPVIETYVRLKEEYGKDIFVDVEVHKISQDKVLDLIAELNDRKDVHGIIAQLPLADETNTQEVLSKITPKKDVDGLGEAALFDPATPQAINWLLVGYNVDLKNKKIIIVGKGRLVGAPLYEMWTKANHDVVVVGRDENLSESLKKADIIVTATGQPGLIKSEDVPIGAVVVDAGVASEEGRVLGDVDDALYERDDLTITPRVGGVGPLTVAALFDNLIRAARL